MHDTDLFVSRRLYIRRRAQRARLDLKPVFLYEADDRIDEVVVIDHTRKLEDACLSCGGHAYG
jgi:hypothetical protein